MAWNRTSVVAWKKVDHMYEMLMESRTSTRTQTQLYRIVKKSNVKKSEGGISGACGGYGVDRGKVF